MRHGHTSGPLASGHTRGPALPDNLVNDEMSFPLKTLEGAFVIVSFSVAAIHHGDEIHGGYGGCSSEGGRRSKCSEGRGDTLKPPETCTARFLWSRAVTLPLARPASMTMTTASVHRRDSVCRRLKRRWARSRSRAVIKLRWQALPMPRTAASYRSQRFSVDGCGETHICWLPRRGEPAFVQVRTSARCGYNTPTKKR